MSSSQEPLVNLLGFSEAQRVSLALTKAIVGSLSLVGSSLLIWHTSTRLLRTPNAHRRRRRLLSRKNSENQQNSSNASSNNCGGYNCCRTYLRLLLGMSIIDVVSSFFTGTLNTVLTRANSGGWGTHGNQATCSFSGFCNQLQAAVPLYNAALAIYFWITIRYGIVAGEKKLRYLEPLLHLVPWGIGLSTATLGVAKGWFNAQIVPEIGCWIEAYPVGCTFTEGLECTRGPTDAATQEDLIIWMSFWPLAGACIIVSIANVFILGFVCLREKQTRRHSFRQSDNRRSNRQIRAVAVQNLLYVAVMVNTVLWVLLADVAIYVGRLPENFYFPLYFLYCVSFPAQGFWNFFVYIRAQYRHLRGRVKLGRCQALWSAASHPLGGASADPMRSSNSSIRDTVNDHVRRFSLRRSSRSSVSKTGADGDDPSHLFNPDHSETSKDTKETPCSLRPAESSTRDAAHPTVELSDEELHPDHHKCVVRFQDEEDDVERHQQEEDHETRKHQEEPDGIDTSLAIQEDDSSMDLDC